MENALLDGYLVTKLVRPQIRSRRVARPRLQKRLNEAVHVPLTVICAPAGYGKTTLLVEWLATCSQPSSWLTLNPEDGDIARFLHYFIFALQRLDADLGKSAQSVLNMPDRSMRDTSLRLLINDIAGMEQEAFLVLDDYHWIDAPAVHEALAYLIENLPQNLHVVIASRTEPPLNLTRLRARAAVVELRMSDLGFQTQESERFINEVMGLQLPPEICQRLAHQTEGWPAGLQLASLSLQRNKPSLPHRMLFASTDWHPGQGEEYPIAAAGQHDIFEFLAEEVLCCQPPEVRRFLLHTSILDALTGPLCDALTESFLPGQNAAACLDALEHANLFTQAVDGEHRWYRYHALFADFLRSRLEATEPQVIPHLHRKAAGWLAAYGDSNTAYSHALAGGDFELAANVIEQYAETLERHGEIATLSRWLAGLPASVIAARPRLNLIRAWIALVDLNMADAQHCVQQAEAALKNTLPAPPLTAGVDLPSGFKALEGEILAVRAMIASFSGDTTHAQMYMDEALRSLADDQGFLISLLKFNLGLPIMLSGELRQGACAMQEAVQAAEQSHTPFIALLALRLAGECYIQLGRLTQAELTFQRAIALVEQEWGGESPLIGAIWLGLGEIYRLRNQLEQAECYLKEGVELCCSWMPSMALDGFLWLAKLQQALGRPVAAQASIQRARQLKEGRGSSLMDEWFVQFGSLRLNIVQGYLDEVQLWLREAGLAGDPLRSLEEHYDAYSPYFQQMVGYVLARFYLEMGRRENLRPALIQARQVLVHFLPSSEVNAIYTFVIEALLLLAQVEAALGNPKQAQDAIHRALELGAPERAVRMFLDEGNVVKNLLLERRSFDLPPAERAYLDILLAAWGEETPAPRQIRASNERIESLTLRETEVLVEIAAGRSNQEIATKLVLSLHTVKRHVSSIMQKLGAKNRTEAVRLGRKFNLLEWPSNEEFL